MTSETCPGCGSPLKVGRAAKARGLAGCCPDMPGASSYVEIDGHKSHPRPDASSKTADLESLRKRVEEATGADRGLDRDLTEALTGECTHRETEYYCIEDGNDYDSGFTCKACGEDLYGKRDWPSYTASLDAALALVGRALPGAYWHLCNNHGADPAALYSADMACPHVDETFGATPALALISALLAALAAGQSPALTQEGR